MRIANNPLLSKRAPRGVVLGAVLSAALLACIGAHAQDTVAALGSQPVPIDSKNLSTMEDRATDNANGVVKHLDSSEAVTLDDLNTARQAVARIDAMIEIEKHLAELDKLRGGGRSLASAIPASALTPPPAPVAQVKIPSEPPAPKHVTPPPAQYEVSRISGSDGNYSAILKNGAEAHIVKVGDTLASGGVVRWISPSSVLIEQNGSTRSLHIKSADAIYSAVR
ncbi:MAG: hypothetical protein P4M15_13620 [Alphaproteobacteria bacterium]|nr:hypothetical protein [Alphaproteobacteria bacterium]